MSLLGDSFWRDMEYEDSVATGNLSLNRITYVCEPPVPHATERVIEGSCAIGGAFCTKDSQCALGQCNYGDFCHQVALDGIGFVFTAAHDPAAILTAGLTGKCPPDCFIDYDFDTYEQEAIEAASRQDRDAGHQIALDHLGGRKYRAGNALAMPASTTTHIWGPPQVDLRCYVGGDPFRANPLDNKIGRCSASTTACATSADCSGGESCRFCGGTHSSDPEYGALAQALDPGDAALALPPRYDDHGFTELSLLAPGGNTAKRRLGGINGVESSSRMVLFATPSTTGVAAAIFKDHTCTGADSCALGQVLGGPPGVTTAQQKSAENVGIGIGGTYTNGQTFPAGGGCCDTGSNITWRPEHPATPVGGLARISDFGPGADGIPDCFGDNGETSPCNDRLGDPNMPGNTGSDDVATRYPNPNLAGNGGVSNPNAGATILATSCGYVAPPNAAVATAYPGASLPTISFRSATALRDLENDTVDSLVKTARTHCPLVGAGPECSPAPDTDGDGIRDCVDNCPFAANPGQQDTGGIGTSNADGIGNACQCGDITTNGIVNGQDGTFITRHGLGYNDPIFADGGNCDVNGNGLCNGQDGVFVTRAGLGFQDPPQLAPRGQNCHNANPAAPPCPSCAPCPSGTCS